MLFGVFWSGSGRCAQPLASPSWQKDDALHELQSVSKVKHDAMFLSEYESFGNSESMFLDCNLQFDEARLNRTTLP